MITLPMFQEYLSSTVPLPVSSNRSVNGQERYLVKLLTTLPSQTPEEQYHHLENVLMALREAHIDEDQRLKLMATVLDASIRLIATLRQQYIYEIGVFDEVQLGYVAQTKSLHYLIIMVYDRIIRQQDLEPNTGSKRSLGNGWQRYFNNKKSSNTLAIALYQSLSSYQKILAEEVLCYRQPASYLWSKINQLYHLAYQHRITDIDLGIDAAVPYANNIYQLYCQICLHSLLNLRGMRRTNILLVQRFLPEWAKHMVATTEPTTKTRIFVDLEAHYPPSYLTANSKINPYEEHRTCLFLELTPMLEYFDSRQQALLGDNSAALEYGLLNTIASTVSYRYLQPPLTLPTKYSKKQEALLITGFNDIHYRVGDFNSFANLVSIKDLAEEERPRYDTFGKEQNSNNSLNIRVFDSYEHLSLFRALQLTLEADEPEKKSASASVNSPSQDIAEEDISRNAPPLLHLMRLFLICHSTTTEQAQADWSMGIVRWTNLDSKEPLIEWQVLGHKLVACGLRLEGRGLRNRHFVPAFILGRDEQLKTTSTLIVPPSYFQNNDRVVMRIGTKQTPLRLGKKILMTDEFSQYEIVQL